LRSVAEAGEKHLFVPRRRAPQGGFHEVRIARSGGLSMLTERHDPTGRQGCEVSARKRRVNASEPPSIAKSRSSRRKASRVRLAVAPKQGSRRLGPGSTGMLGAVAREGGCSSGERERHGALAVAPASDGGRQSSSGPVRLPQPKGAGGQRPLRLSRRGRPMPRRTQAVEAATAKNRGIPR
jgi:hypothetical protein